MIADDLLNCSENYRLLLNNLLNRRFPDTNRLVGLILNKLNIKDLSSPEKSLEDLYRIAQVLNLGKWTEDDQISKIIAHFKIRKSQSNKLSKVAVSFRHI
jgi:hypothetical protein